MFVLHALVTIVPGGEAAYEALARQLIVATLRAEPGVRRYEYFRLTEPRQYLTVLSFDDHAAFIEHQASEHHVALTNAMKPLMEHISLERLDPIEAGATDDPGVIATVGADVLDERRQRYSARYPFPSPGWWSTTRPESASSRGTA
jgi:quinol monooxygenase YgiN